MSEKNPILLAMILGAQARFLPVAYEPHHRGDREPSRAYHQLKEAIARLGPIDVNILDVGPGSEGRQQILADSLQQQSAVEDAQVRHWAGVVLESVLAYSPRTMAAAGFSADEVGQALDALQKQPA